MGIRPLVLAFLLLGLGLTKLVERVGGGLVDTTSIGVVGLTESVFFSKVLAIIGLVFEFNNTVSSSIFSTITENQFRLNSCESELAIIDEAEDFD